MKTSLKNRPHNRSNFFQFFSKSSGYLKTGNKVGAEERGPRVSDTEVLKFIALPFPFSCKLNIWLFQS